LPFDAARLAVLMIHSMSARGTGVGLEDPHRVAGVDGFGHAQ